MGSSLNGVQHVVKAGDMTVFLEKVLIERINTVGLPSRLSEDVAYISL